MKRTAIFLGAATLTLAALGAQMNGEAEERYRAKYGRYTQAFEARQKVPATLQAAACCRNMNASLKNELRESFSEAVFRSKYGRSTTAVAAGEELAAEANAKHARMCVELGKCTLMEGQVNLTPQREAAGNGESYRAKYGRAFGPSGKEVQFAAARVPCEHACCRRS